jgi:hypothetical protein
VNTIGILSASGTGVNLSLPLTISSNVVSNYCVTTTGSQTISFSGTFSSTSQSNGSVSDRFNSAIQAAVFIYTPPF